MATGIIRLDEGWRLDEGHHFDAPPNVLAPVPPAPRKPTSTKGTKTMDFIPNKRAERYQWWKNLSAHITAEGAKLGLTAGQVTAIKAMIDDQVAKMEARDAADAAAAGASAAEKTATITNEAAIRAAVRNWKTLPAYPASGSEGVLGLKGTSVAAEPASFKSVLKVSIDGAQVRIDFTKGVVDGVNIYSRLRGAVGWHKLGLDTSSPYYDTTALAVAGVAETREYMARGVLDDEEVGLDSDIVSIVFGG